MPLNGDLRNYGTTKLPSPSRTQVTYGSGKMGTSATCIIGWHLNEEILGNAWSVAMWVKPASLGVYNNILFCKNTSSSSDCQIYFSIAQDTTLNLGINNHSSDVTGAVSFTTGTWYHVAATYDGSIGTIYLNGQELNHKAVPSTYSSNKLNICINGRSSNEANTTYTGWFTSSYNDFRLYDNCLSAAEVKELAQGLVLHYKMGNNGVNYNLFHNGYNFTENNLALTRSTIPEIGLLQITPTGSAAYAKYKTDLNYTQYNNKTYTLSFDAQEIEASNTSYTTDYIRIYYGFSIASRYNNIFGSEDSYTYRNVSLLGTGWQHYVATFEVPAPLASGTTSAQVDGSSLTIQLARRGSKKPIQVKNIKLEIGSQDTGCLMAPINSGASPNLIEDNSGYGHHGEIINPISQETNSPRYSACTHFNATDQKIKISNFPTAGFGDSYTFSWWAKADQLNMMHWGFNNGILLNGLYTGHLWNTGDSANNPLYVPGTTTQVTNPTINEWHHWVMTGDGTTCKVYQDGEHWGTAKTYKSISGSEIFINGWANTTAYSSSNFSVSDFRIYCTALDANAVKQLYQLGAKIDNKGNLHTFELNEISSNVFRSELIMPYAKSSSGSHGQIVERNGYPAIAIQPVPFYQNLANNESGFLCNEFIPNTQYIIDLWIDSELVMNGSNPSTGGLYLDYTDGTSVGNAFIVTGGIAGWQHKYYITEANKSIKKVSIRYGVNKTVYFRADSFMAPIGTHKIIKTGRVITPSLSENSDIYKIQKGGNDLTNQIIEL